MFIKLFRGSDLTFDKAVGGRPWLFRRLYAVLGKQVPNISYLTSGILIGYYLNDVNITWLWIF